MRISANATRDGSAVVGGEDDDKDDDEDGVVIEDEDEDEDDEGSVSNLTDIFVETTSINEPTSLAWSSNMVVNGECKLIVGWSMIPAQSHHRILVVPSKQWLVVDVKEFCRTL